MELKTFVKKHSARRAQFNFVWLFAIIAGGAILFLAIYGATQIGDTKGFQTNTEIAKSISIITDPLQSGFAASSFGKISLQQESRINNFCYDKEFGKNEISVSTRSGIGKEWSTTGAPIAITNKYIFSSERNTGKDYYVFSKPFNFPYEISDMIFITPEKYCFVSNKQTEEIIDEITMLKMPNIEVDNCSSESIKVCFNNGNDCDITVYGSCTSGCDSVFDSGEVIKGSQEMKYVGNLMYAAIFSDKNIYDCNVKRLMHRNAKLAEMFSEKVDLMNARDCASNLKVDLVVWQTLVTNTSSEDLIPLMSESERLDKKNNKELCGTW